MGASDPHQAHSDHSQSSSDTSIWKRWLLPLHKGAFLLLARIPHLLLLLAYFLPPRFSFFVSFAVVFLIFLISNCWECPGFGPWTSFLSSHAPLMIWYSTIYGQLPSYTSSSTTFFLRLKCIYWLLPPRLHMDIHQSCAIQQVQTQLFLTLLSPQSTLPQCNSPPLNTAIKTQSHPRLHSFSPTLYPFHHIQAA